MKYILWILTLVIPIILVAFIPGDTDSVYLIPQQASSVCSNDLELDGDNDLIVGNLTPFGGTNPTLSILKNNGTGYFSISDTTKSFPGYQEYIITANIDNDSFPDIVTQTGTNINGNTERFIRIYYNDGLGGFNNFLDFPLNGGNDVISGITVGDVNGDMKQDVIMLVNPQKYWGVLYNDGQGGLLPPVYYNINNYAFNIEVGDLNSDGRDDILIPTVPIYIFYSYPTGFQLDSLSGDATIVKVNDVDNDGKPDIIGRRFLFGTQIVVYENTGTANFILHTIADFPFYSNQMVLSDMNNDSLMDIILTTDSFDGIYILYNQGNFVFSNAVFVPIPPVGNENGRRICTNDFDGNGFNDIALVKNSGGTGTQYPNLILLFNDGNGNFVPDPITSINKQTASLPCMKCIPNPIHDNAIFDLTIQKTSEVDISIYNLEGELVKCLLTRQLEGGNNEVFWNGNDIHGTRCAPGIYFVSLKIDGKPDPTIKIILE